MVPAEHCASFTSRNFFVLYNGDIHPDSDSFYTRGTDTSSSPKSRLLDVP